MAPDPDFLESSASKSAAQKAAEQADGNGFNPPEVHTAQVSPARLGREDFMAAGNSSVVQPAFAQRKRQPPLELLILLALALMTVGLSFDNLWLAFTGIAVALLISLRILVPLLWTLLTEVISPQERLIIAGFVGLTLSGFGILRLSGWGSGFGEWYNSLRWEAIGATGEVFGAIGQILIAVLAVYIAWRQYVISKDLTIQQNMITQQQTIDSYFQGVSDLVLDEEGLLEDWPQERAIAEGRTAAILSSVDAGGKAKVLRFLSRSRLLSPLQRDRRLGRAILDGKGGYAEDRYYGVRVIDLGVMLAGADLSRYRSALD